MDYRSIISINQEIRFGKPCVAGARITVNDVPGWLASGMSVEDIVEDYPELSIEKISACLNFAADKEHKFKIAS